MNNFQLVSCILEQTENDSVETSADIKNDPKLLSIKKKAEDIRVKAELLRAQNQIAKASLDNERIKDQVEKQKAEHKKKQTVSIAKQQAQANQDQSMDSGDPINTPHQQEQVTEDILEPSNTTNNVNEENEEDLSKVPGEDQEIGRAHV
jgi:hypothetical protein